MSNHLKEAEQALSRLAAHEAFMRRNIDLAFRQKQDPLRLFAEGLIGISVVHANAVNKLHVAQTAEIENFIQQLRDRSAELGSEHRVVLFGLLVRDPEQFIKRLIYALGAALLVGFIIGRF